MIVGAGVDGRYGFSAADQREIARSAVARGFGSLWTNAVRGCSPGAALRPGP